MSRYKPQFYACRSPEWASNCCKAAIALLNSCTRSSRVQHGDIDPNPVLDRPGAFGCHPRRRSIRYGAEFEIAEAIDALIAAAGQNPLAMPR
jgi:hypothetical protein